MISLSPTLSSPRPASTAARSSSRDTGAAPPGMEPRESPTEPFRDLFVWGILGRDVGTLWELWADSEARPETSASFLLSTAAQRVSLSTAMMERLPEDELKETTDT